MKFLTQIFLFQKVLTRLSAVHRATLCLWLALVGLAIPAQAASYSSAEHSLTPEPYRSQSYHHSVATEVFSEARLHQLLSPIALYPDTILAHILIAATYPLEVVQAERWAHQNGSYGGQAAVDGVGHKPWDPSVKALVAFPDLLKRMVDNLDWTQDLGEAFLVDEGTVMAAVQTLRQQAYEAGHLDHAQHLRVVRKKRVIYIEPYEERVVYLPHYDPTYVYGHWRWNNYHPIVWHYPSRRHHHHGNRLSVGIFGWGHRVSLSTTFYFGGIHWANRHVVVVDRPIKIKRYTSRNIVRHQYAKRWHHNPKHRRQVAYRHRGAHKLFGDLRRTHRTDHLHHSRGLHHKEGHRQEGHRPNRENHHRNGERYRTPAKKRDENRYATHHVPKPKLNRALDAKRRATQDQTLSHKRNHPQQRDNLERSADNRRSTFKSHQQTQQNARVRLPPESKKREFLRPQNTLPKRHQKGEAKRNQSDSRNYSSEQRKAKLKHMKSAPSHQNRASGTKPARPERYGQK